MAAFDCRPLDIEGACEIQPFSAEDLRGKFTKMYEQNVFSRWGIDFSPNESFVSVSRKNVIRGMHFQLNGPQKKLVTVLSGKIYDVLIDLRKKSATFGQWRGVYLSSEKCNSLFIPRGCAHGFLAVEDHSMVLYQCEGAYDKATDMGIRYDDPKIGVIWPSGDGTYILNDRDRKFPSLQELRRAGNLF